MRHRFIIFQRSSASLLGSGGLVKSGSGGSGFETQNHTKRRQEAPSKRSWCALNMFEVKRPPSESDVEIRPGARVQVLASSSDYDSNYYFRSKIALMFL
ncbi:hypothetical protein AVEN_195583-1 [Araneus ventricosus]|uniref:Uncharacterized protein n=1 Tax=Araneus ventricosus TaxID=182803 RepID=A0A4Y2B9W7_ARAVE|nr:hypothetical protein AVEN_195583-1 [Araneus ventricosus]